MPMCMRMGMTSKEFYHSTLRTINMRLDAYLDNIEIQSNKSKVNAWLQGLYVRCAIGSALNGSKYPEMPEIDTDNGFEESKEQVAVYEMKQRISQLGNLKASPI